jgi:transposase-like protein
LTMFYQHSSHLDSLPNSAVFVTLQKMARKIAMTKAGLSALIRREGARCKDGLELSLERIHQIGPYLGIDYMYLRIKRKWYYLWHVVDLLNNDVIHYTITENKDEDAALSVVFEMKFKLVGYVPKVIVCDLDKPEIKACKKAYEQDSETKVIIQGCTQHRRSKIIKRLPLEGKFAKRQTPERLQRWRDFRTLVWALLESPTVIEKNQILATLKAEESYWHRDKRVSAAYRQLMSAIDYYHTGEQLGGCPFDNNIVEERNRHIRELANRMKGFKTVETRESTPGRTGHKSNTVRYH